MSVILFSREDFQKLADAYESMKPFMHPFWSGADEKFYTALRRLYFANVAAYLCQYHDDSPLGDDELTGIDPFQELKGKPKPGTTPIGCVYTFVEVWSLLTYNFVTNDGEEYRAKQSYEFMNDLALSLCRAVMERYAPKA